MVVVTGAPRGLPGARVAALGALVFRAPVMLMLVGAYYLIPGRRPQLGRSRSGDRATGDREGEPYGVMQGIRRVALFGASSLADRIPSKMTRVQTTTNDGRTRLAFPRRYLTSCCWLSRKILENLQCLWQDFACR
jgi:hypothetical protein